VNIGFVGIGNMGWPMAGRLRHAGHNVSVADSNLQLTDRFREEFGGEPTLSLKMLGAVSEVVITMLPTSASVKRVLFDDNGVVAGLRPGSLVLEMGSGEPGRTREFSKEVRRRGSSLVDAPVSGGVERAKRGELSIMAGGAVEDIERARPILDALGNSLTIMGDVGSAHAMKALNNLASAASLLISIEALLIGRKQGLDPELMVDVLNASTGMSNSSQKKLRQFVLSRKFNSGFGLDLMAKDLSIALGMASESRIPAPFAERCREIWSAASGEEAGRDHTEIARYSERLAGIVLSGQRRQRNS
jgi:3-hydroxyisobutyrate dehydrogenase